MKAKEKHLILALLFALIPGASPIDLTLDLPSGEKKINFSIEAEEHYNPKPYMKRMMKLEKKYILCVHENGVRKEAFFECVGENYSKIMSDMLAEYFEFLKEVNNYLNEQKVILCKAHYSRFCADWDMFLREQLAGENLHKETFVLIFKGLKLAEEFKDQAYYDYLRHLFKAVDELVEMRKLAVSYTTMAAKKCEKFVNHFKFLNLDYDAGDMDRIKVLMQLIDSPLAPDYVEKLEAGVRKVDKGQRISNIPNLPVWGNEAFQNGDSDSLPDAHGSGPLVHIGGQAVHLDADSSNVRDDSFNNSVLREKEYMKLLKNLEARGNLKMEGHDEEKLSTAQEKSLYDLSDLDSLTLH